MLVGGDRHRIGDRWWVVKELYDLAKNQILYNIFFVVEFLDCNHSLGVVHNCKLMPLRWGIVAYIFDNFTDYNLSADLIFVDFMCFHGLKSPKW